MFLVGVCSSSPSVGRLWKRWILIDTVKDCLRKRDLDVRQAERREQDRSEWWGFVRGNVWGIAQGMNLDEMPQLFVATSISNLWVETCLWLGLQLKG